MISLNEKICKLKLHENNPQIPNLAIQLEKIFIEEIIRLDFSVIYATICGKRKILDTPFM